MMPVSGGRLRETSSGRGDPPAGPREAGRGEHQPGEPGEYEKIDGVEDEEAEDLRGDEEQGSTILGIVIRDGLARFVGRHGVPAFEPTMQVDVGAALRAERRIGGGRRLAADRTGFDLAICDFERSVVRHDRHSAIDSASVA